MLELRCVSAGYQDGPVVENINLEFRPGEVLALVGPNGSGKSTLLRAALNLAKCYGGEILLDGIPLGQLTPREVAQKAAFLAQSRQPCNITARKMVLHGRFPYLCYPRRYRPEDYAIADAALKRVDALELADCSLEYLSGGQRQKVYLAMAVAQQTDTILMDEPTTYLDMAHQFSVMALVRSLAEEGRAVVLVLHDLPLALENAHRVAVLHEGRLRMADTPEAIFQSGILDTVFGVRITRAECGGKLHYFCEPRDESV